MTSDGPWTALRPPDRFALAPPRSLPPDPAIVSLEPWHAVIALGTDGGQPLADGDELARGVHLLWTLRPELGFPAEGYDVYRRRHRPPEWGCLDPPNGLLPPKGRTQWEFLDTQLAVEGDGVRLDADACPPTGAAHVVGQGSLTVMEPRRRAAVRAVGQGDPPLVEVLADTGDGPQVIASAPADAREGGGWSAEVWAQGIVGCRLSGEDMRICLVCFGDADETGGWQKLNEQPVLTPVVTPGTANEPANLHGPDATRAEARGRLSASLPRAAKDALSAGFADVGELVEDALRDGRGALLPAAATDTTGARTPPRLALATLGAVAVTAVDPDVARMLGLYWHDPVDDGRFDYKVVARHGAVRFPGPVIAFGELAPGAAGSTLDVDGVHFVGTAGLEIVASGRTRALRVPAPVIGTAAGLRLDRTVPAITLRVADATGTAFTAWRGSQRVASAVAFIGPVTLEDPGGIDAVTWSVGPLDLLEVELHPRAGLIGDLPAYAWRLSPTSPEPVHGLDLTEVASAVEPTRLRPDGTLDDATGVVGLDWRATSAASDPGRPVRVHVGRADPGAEPEVRNADRPAAAFARSPGNARPGPDVPRRWIEHGLAAGSYGWSVRGIDVFGRLGDWSEERMVAVGAGVVPPPPDAVTAAYLDPADPSLPDEHRALAERDGPGLLVEWTWPAGHRIAAPGVEPRGEFRVYARRDDPNVLNGTVLASPTAATAAGSAPIEPSPAIATTSPASACASAARASRSSAMTAPRSRSPTSRHPPSARRPGRSRSTSRPRARCPRTSRVPRGFGRADPRRGGRGAAARHHADHALVAAARHARRPAPARRPRPRTARERRHRLPRPGAARRTRRRSRCAARPSPTAASPCRPSARTPRCGPAPATEPGCRGRAHGRMTTSAGR